MFALQEVAFSLTVPISSKSGKRLNFTVAHPVSRPLSGSTPRTTPRTTPRLRTGSIRERLTAAATHSDRSLRSPLRSKSEIEAIVTCNLMSAFFEGLQSTPGLRLSYIIFAAAQVAIGCPVNNALRLIKQGPEGLNSSAVRNFYLPKVVTAACKPIGQSVVQAANPVLRVLFISDRVDHVSSGKYGVEAAILRQLFKVNDPYGGRLLNKNPDAKNCNARPGYFGIVAALVFPNGIEASGWHVQRQNTVVPHRVPIPTLVSSRSLHPLQSSVRRSTPG